VVALAATAAAFGAPPPAGRFDRSFGGDGVVVRRLTDGFDVGRAAVALPDGSVLVAADSGGKRRPFRGPDAVLLKLRRNGTPDRSFGRAGVLRVSVGRGDDSGSGLARLADGSLVGGGAAANLNADAYANDVAVFAFRSRPNGRLDAGFGRGGIAVHRVSTQGFIEPVAGIAAGRDGSVVVAATTYEKRLTLVRFDARGRVDRAFGTRGVATHDVQYPRALTRLPDGRLVVVGMTFREDREWREWFVLRLRANGTRDPSFGGGDGLVETSWSGSPEAALAVVADRRGRILVAGEEGTSDVNCTTLCDRLRLARYLPDGRLDRSFGRGGRAAPEIGLAYESLGLTLDRRGGIVVAGASYVEGSADRQLALWRFDAAGRIDRSFGVNGMLAANPATGRLNLDYATAVTTAPDGSLVAAGATAKPTTGFDSSYLHDVVVLKAR
jgi:uncharacterized delta-60 repeat protein